jgi:hypothetical protein
MVTAGATEPAEATEATEAAEATDLRPAIMVAMMKVHGLLTMVHC